MQRRNKIFAFLTASALVLWIALGSYLFSENCCGDNNSVLANGEIPQVGFLRVADGSGLKIESNQAILFGYNQSQPIIADKTSEELLKIVRYVKSSPLKIVTIMGLYKGSESEGAALGKARADSLYQFFINSGTPEYQLNIQVGRRDDLQEVKSADLVVGAVDFVFSCLAPFEVKDTKTGFKIQANNNLVFRHGSSDFLMELTTEMMDNVLKIAGYLKNQPNRKLLLTGYNHPEEKNTTALSCIGEARANMLRGLLISHGASGTQIEIKGIEAERLVVMESALYGKFLPNAMGFEFGELNSADLKKVAQIKKQLEEDFKEKKVFRFKDFEPNENKIIVDDRQKAYLNDLILYFSLNDKALVYCVGHSNPLESDELEFKKASERAQYVQEYLIRHGIKPERIVLKSAGATHPLGEETTQYGQHINRRVDLFISYDGKEPPLQVLPPFVSKSSVKKGKTEKDTIPKVDNKTKDGDKTPPKDSIQ